MLASRRARPLAGVVADGGEAEPQPDEVGVGGPEGKVVLVPAAGDEPPPYEIAPRIAADPTLHATRRHMRTAIS